MIINLLSELHRTHRLTSIYVTHNPSFARRCDRVLRLEAGNLVPDSDMPAERVPCGPADAGAVGIQSGTNYV
jgi:ABC-type lipoprotein export system ATPase subunit